jgi:hypothetical protein
MDTFVVRVWTPAEPGQASIRLPDELHGTAHHVTSGRATTFRTGCELLRLLVDLRQPAALGGAASPSDASPAAALPAEPSPEEASREAHARDRDGSPMTRRSPVNARN